MSALKRAIFGGWFANLLGTGVFGEDVSVWVCGDVESGHDGGLEVWSMGWWEIRMTNVWLVTGGDEFTGGSWIADDEGLQRGFIVIEDDFAHVF